MSDITSETIQKVLEISKPEVMGVEDAHGITTNYSTKQLYQVQATPFKTPEALAVHTLGGFADLVRAKLDDAEFAEAYVIHVVDENQVALRARVADDYGRRQVLVLAEPVKFQQFRFSQWTDQESFAIAIAALFAESPDRAYVLSLSSTLTNDATSSSEDDGFTQRVNVKAGLKMKEAITIKPKVSLAPYRTFPELDQPISDFVFRARTGSDGVSLSLIEADGGRWKLEAIARIKAALESFELGVPVIA